MRQRVFEAIGAHRWVIGEGCRFPEGDYIDPEGGIRPSIYSLEELLEKAERGILVELSTLDPDREVDEGL